MNGGRCSDFNRNHHVVIAFGHADDFRPQSVVQVFGDQGQTFSRKCRHKSCPALFEQRNREVVAQPVKTARHGRDIGVEIPRGG